MGGVGFRLGWRAQGCASALFSRFGGLSQVRNVEPGFRVVAATRSHFVGSEVARLGLAAVCRDPMPGRRAALLPHGDSRHGAAMDFPNEFPGNFAPERHGLSYEKAIRYYCDHGIHESCRKNWLDALITPVGSIHAERAWGPAERNLLERLGRRELWGYGRPQSARNGFQRIEPHEWPIPEPHTAHPPQRQTDGGLRIGGTSYYHVHIWNEEGVRYEVARLAFGPQEAVNEYDAADSSLMHIKKNGRVLIVGKPDDEQPLALAESRCGRAYTAIREILERRILSGDVQVRAQTDHILGGWDVLFPRESWPHLRLGPRDDTIYAVRYAWNAPSRVWHRPRFRLPPVPFSETRTALENGSPATVPIAAEAAAGERRQRRGGMSYAEQDAPLIDKMERMLDAGEAPNRWQAALAVANQAAGGGQLESKARRLLEGFQNRSALNTSEQD